MRHGIKGAAALTALAALMLLAWAPALAGQKMTWKEVSHITQVYKMKAPDAEDHLLGLHEHKGVALFPDGRAASYLTRGGFSVYERQGGERTHDGYGKISFADGSFILIRYQGQEYFKEGDKLPSLQGKGRFMQGAGRFKGITGTLSYDGGYVTGLDDKDVGGDAVLNYQADYTLQK